MVNWFTSYITLLLILPLLGAVINGLVGHRLPRALVGFIANATVFGAFLIAALLANTLATTPNNQLSVTIYSWIQTGNLNIDISLTFDRLSAVMSLVVCGVGFIIHLYSLGYMAHDRSLARYFAYLNLFIFSMLLLVLADSLPLMFVGWEGVGLCSYLLIGFWYEDEQKAAAGKKAFIVNRIGDFGFIIAMALLLRVSGTLNIAALKHAFSDGTVSLVAASAAALLFILAATGKSAQIPLYVWLPDAMAGPTPVSALIHAATMVTAGVYLTARVSFLFTAAPLAMLVLAIIGALTALFAASIATAANDIKKVLAYSTISQLGFMFIAAGVGAYAVAIFHLVTHAFFKACLFLGAGSVIHGLKGEQDMRQMGGLWRRMPITATTFLIATIAITGILPGISGFISKDAILWNAFVAGAGEYADLFGSFAYILWGVGIIAAGLTSFYMWRAFFMTFASGSLRAKQEIAAAVRESPKLMTTALVTLAFAALFAGLLAWPHVFGGSNWFSHWLLPILPPSPAPISDFFNLEISLMVVTTTIALLGLVLAYALYGKAINPFASRLLQKPLWQWLHERFIGKWHIDELYDVTICRPLKFFANTLFAKIIDKGIIDGLVGLISYVARTLGIIGQALQSGNIQRYIAIFAIALAVLLYGWLLPAATLPSSITATNIRGVPSMHKDR